MRGPPSRKAPLHEIALIGLQVVVAAASTLLVARLVHERRTRPATGWLVVYAAAIWLWAVFAVVEATAPHHAARLVAEHAQWLGTCVGPVSYLMLVAGYTGTSALRRGPARTAVLGCTAAAVALVSTNGLHGLVWRSLGDHGAGFVHPAWGPAFYVLAGWGFGCAAAGLVLLTRAYLRAPAAYHATFAPVVGAAALPLLASIAVFVGPPGLATVLLTGAFAVSAATMRWCLLRFPVLVQRGDSFQAARSTIVELMREGVLVVDADGVVVDANPAASSLLGVRVLVGRRAVAVLPGWPVEAIVAPPAGVRDLRVPERRTGRVLDVLVTGIPGADAREDRVIVMRDATDRARAEDELERLAHVDVLTGLANRSRFDAELSGLVAAGARFTLLVVDLDGFKAVNDTYGHPYGDALLLEAGALLRATVADGAFAARLGGDEFGVLVPGAGHAEGVGHARALAAAFDRVLDAGGFRIQLSASIGVASCPDHGDDAATLYRRADIAMYEAKRSRSRVATYDAATDANTPARLALVSALRGAVARDELVLHYQPVVRTSDLRPVGLEALVRWQRPGVGLVPPGAFLPLAAEAGIAHDLVRRVVRQALADLPCWPDDIVVGVNVTAGDLRDPGFVEELVGLVAEHGVAPHRLVIELTESVLIDERPDSPEYRALARLREAGLTLVLDDFGTGHASMLVLRDVPWEAFKIAGTLVKGARGGQADRMLVEALVRFGAHLDRRVVAEWVEDDEMLGLVRALGADLAQGHGICPPLPREAVRAWLEAQAERAEDAA